MTPTELELLIALHESQPRLGPGSEAHTRQALALSGLKGGDSLRIADLGCGTGASALVLAQELDAHIVAVDMVPAFLRELTRRAQEQGLAERIDIHEASIGAPPFEAESLDAIWSEGAIYNVGFEEGVERWRPVLKHNGLLAVSELTWLRCERPLDLEEV